MAIMHSKGFFSVVMVLTCCLGTGRFANGQAVAKTSPVHLVGDEDTALLNRVQDVLDDWDPRKLQNPYVESAQSGDPKSLPVRRRLLKRPDLKEFIADVEAAEALGKAFFWEMQAGSDFRRVNNTFIGTACASCHYRFGADARDRHTTRIPYVVWDQYKLDPKHPLAYNEKQLPFDPKHPLANFKNSQRSGDPDVIVNSSDLYKSSPKTPGVRKQVFEEDEGDLGDDDESAQTPLPLIVGSQGVEPRIFTGLKPFDTNLPASATWVSEESEPRKPSSVPNYKPEWSMFIEGQQDTGRLFRQITSRNSPSVINAGFANRLFHDGRAESTFNGFSIFGDHDKREVIHVRRPGGELVPVQVAITNAALASQAVGPIVSDIEMSYNGRTFQNLARKLLDAEVLKYQEIADDDGHLGLYKSLKLVGPGSSYRVLIKRAFRREWWDGSDPTSPSKTGFSEDDRKVEIGFPGGENAPDGTLMEANFSLYWGLSILLYESSLISNLTPFDAMMQGNSTPVNDLWTKEKAKLEPIYIDRLRTIDPAFKKDPPPKTPEPRHPGTSPFPFKSGAEVFQRGFRAFLSRGCFDCHSGPLFSELYSRQENGEVGVPIAFTLERILLPNSKADAIAIQLKKAKERTIEKVVKLLDKLIDPETQSLRKLVGRLALELDLLREEAQGKESILADLISKRLAADKLATDSAGQIASILMAHEKTASRSFGNRLYFTEDERVAYDALIVDPVLLEKMLIPRSQVTNRPPLPIAGPLATNPYAFYDLGFYTLGAAPPRYDRGIGDWSYDEHQDVADPASLKTKLTSHYQAANGSAYKFDPRWRQPLRKRSPLNGRYATEKARSTLPKEKPADAPRQPQDTTSHADKSWYRDLPMWDHDFLTTAPEKSVDKRRNDVHFYSRARKLVTVETPWGYRKPFVSDNELAFWGAFKTPTLRNVELTAPYMHNGRLQTLFDVVEFYDRGGDLPADRVNNPDKHPALVKLDLSLDDKLSIVFFLMCLTDERVRTEKAPFDHPSLAVANGYQADLSDKILDLKSTGGCTPPPERKTYPSDQ